MGQKSLIEAATERVQELEWNLAGILDCLSKVEESLQCVVKGLVNIFNVIQLVKRLWH